MIITDSRVKDIILYRLILEVSILFFLDSFPLRPLKNHCNMPNLTLIFSINESDLLYVWKIQESYRNLQIDDDYHVLRLRFLLFDDYQEYELINNMMRKLRINIWSRIFESIVFRE